MALCLFLLGRPAKWTLISEKANRTHLKRYAPHIFICMQVYTAHRQVSRANSHAMRIESWRVYAELDEMETSFFECCTHTKSTAVDAWPSKKNTKGRLSELYFCIIVWLRCIYRHWCAARAMNTNIFTFTLCKKRWRWWCASFMTMHTLSIYAAAISGQWD